ncbi:MAG: hypothetical protein BRD50_08350 [Bacteroidetes bacterium SW_11_45_7]|nr:MAG: hypothetical protein BRD50_08350 [Bacteroidetes bacterium SW_11_45_7]
MRILPIGLFLLVLVGSNIAIAQNKFIRVDNVPVTESGAQITNPWAGGLNNAHFGKVDLNDDGTRDLVVFERSDAELMTFINNGNSGQVSFSYAHEYEQHLPDVTGWMKIRDINCDGINDILTSKNTNNAGVYPGAYNSNGEIQFTADGVLEKDGITGVSPIYVNPQNVPACKDINNDGDLDLLTYDQIDNSFIIYLENQSMELTGTCGDTVIYEVVDECWANIYESGLSRKATIKDSCSTLTPKTNQGAAHAGASMVAFDEDGDNVQDLLMGSLSFNSINRLKNEGTPDTAEIMAQDTLFPSYDRSVDLPYFPVPFHMDVDNDGVDDLLVSTNAANGSRNYACVSYYKNTGTMSNQTFTWQTDTFLTQNMLDFGEGAYPAFIDYNDDGKQDIVIGNSGYFSSTSSFISKLALLENTTTNGNLSFELVTRDFSGLGSLNQKNLTPTFGDIDDDGQKEMITGNEDGTLILFDNTGSQGNASFSLQNANYKGIDVGQFSAPFLYDANSDGLLDLIIGRKQGNLLYFENIGTASPPDFNSSATNNTLGEVDVRQPGFIEGYSRPQVTKLDATAQPYLLVGAKAGYVHLYEFDRDSLTSGAFPEITDQLTQTDHGERVQAAVADLNGDQDREMIIGNYRGGLKLFSQSDSIGIGIKDQSVSTFDLSLFPNPAEEQITIRFSKADQDQKTIIKMFNTRGKAADIPSGLFFVRIQKGGKQATRKVILR